MFLVVVWRDPYSAAFPCFQWVLTSIFLLVIVINLLQDRSFNLSNFNFSSEWVIFLSFSSFWVWSRVLTSWTWLSSRLSVFSESYRFSPRLQGLLFMDFKGLPCRKKTILLFVNIIQTWFYFFCSIQDSLKYF